MAKKKNKQTPPKKQHEEKLSLGDLLNKDVLTKLKETQSELKAAEQRKQEEETKRKQEERRIKEKNKSFEELFNESGLKWTDFK